MGLIMAAGVVFGAGPARAADPVFRPLGKHLRAAGLPAKQVGQWLGSGHLKFEAGLMAALLAKHEHTLDYGQFLKPEFVARARGFAKKYRTQLIRAQRATGVEPEVVVAIIAVESNLGSYTGNHRTFNVLASQAVLDTGRAKGKLKRRWPRGQLAEFKKPEFAARLAKRAAWARDELVALARLGIKEKRSPLSYRGSLAGAMGLCQFVPTSLARFGRDGNRDGVVDLHHPHDAIHSVAMYLQGYGWNQGRTRVHKSKVLYQYNRSRIYGRTVLALARRLK